MSSMPPTRPGRSSPNTFAQPAATAERDPVSRLGEADLRRIEQALLDAILDVHPNQTNALDRLLDDMAADHTHDDTEGAPDRGAGHTRRQQVEELLVAAVLDTGPDRNRELDRLLGETPDPGVHAAFA